MGHVIEQTIIFVGLLPAKLSHFRKESALSGNGGPENVFEFRRPR